MIDRSSAVLTDLHTLWAQAQRFRNKGFCVPAAVSPDAMRRTYEDAKFFLVVATAWDMMLGPAPETKRERQADLEGLQATVNLNCADRFPASLMELLEWWVAGKDITTIV